MATEALFVPSPGAASTGRSGIDHQGSGGSSGPLRVLDDEMILPKLSGASDFDAFRKAITSPEALAFVPFDILRPDGEDLRPLPLIERKEQLWRLVEPAQGAIQYSEHVEADGREFLAAVDGMGLEAWCRSGLTAPTAAGGPSIDAVKVRLL